jgi:hypothetical protein
MNNSYKEYASKEYVDNEIASVSWDNITDKPFGEETSVVFDGQFQTVQNSDGTVWMDEMYVEDTSDNTMIVGETYIIIWNGVEYELECFEEMNVPVVGNLALGGHENNDVPFALFRDVNNTMGMGKIWYVLLATMPADFTVYTCKVEGAKVNKIDKKYLPDNLVSGLNNVPHVEEQSSYMTFTTTPEHYFSVLGYTWWKVSDLIPTTEEILEGQFIGKFGDNPVTWTPSSTELMADTEAITVVLSDAYGMGFAICRVSGEHTVNIMNMDVTVNVPVTGIYFGYVEGQTVPTNYEIGVSFEKLQKLDVRLLPDEFEDIVNSYIQAYLEEHGLV